MIAALPFGVYVRDDEIRDVIRDMTCDELYHELCDGLCDEWRLKFIPSISLWLMLRIVLWSRFVDHPISHTVIGAIEDSVAICA